MLFVKATIKSRKFKANKYTITLKLPNYKEKIKIECKRKKKKGKKLKNFSFQGNVFTL